MAKKKTVKITKRDVWFKYFTDPSNREIFLNATASAKAAGYKAKSESAFSSIGHENLTILDERINKWMEDVGLSENALNRKHIQLLDAEETKLIKAKGAVNGNELLPGCEVITVTGEIITSKDGDQTYGDGETILAVNMPALGIQAKALDMGLKRKGMYAPEKREHSGEITVKGEMNVKGLKDAIKRDQET